MTTSTALPGGSAPPTRRAPVRSAALVLLLAAASGLALGAATEVGQGLLAGGPLNVLVNSVGAWLVLSTAVAAVLVSRLRRAQPAPVAAVEVTLATAAGLVALEGLVAGYYGWAVAVSGTPHAATSIAYWVLAGCVGGPVAGAAAWCWTTRTGWLRAAGAGFIGAVLLSEGARQVAGGARVGAGVLEAAVGVTAVLALLHGADRWRGLALLAAASVAGIVCFPLANALWPV